MTSNQSIFIRHTIQKAFAFALIAGSIACQDNTDIAKDSYVFGEKVKVLPGPVERKVYLTGNLVSPVARDLVIERVRWYWEYNIRWTAEEGHKVKKGDPIIKLDPSTIQKDLDSALASLEQAQLEYEETKVEAKDDLADANAGIKRAAFDLKKAELMVSDHDSVSAKEKQKQRLEVAAAKAALARAKEKISVSKNRFDNKLKVKELNVKRQTEDVEILRAGLAKMELSAPQDGIVVFPPYNRASSWQKAHSGGSVNVGTAVASVVQQNTLMVKIFVPEVDAQDVQEGTPGIAVLDIMDHQQFTGKIHKVSQVPSTFAERSGQISSKPNQNLREIEAFFALDQLPPEVMPGMTVRVVLTPSRTKKDVLRVPIAAITNSQQALGSQAKGPASYVYAKSQEANRFEWQAVEIGQRSANWVEITAGLKSGDEVRTILW